jgi:hypothetical protein
MDKLRGLIRRPHVEQLTRAWAETDPDLVVLRSDRLLLAFERFLEHLKTGPPAAWAAAIDRYANYRRAQSDGLFVTSMDFVGAQALFIGEPLRVVPVTDLRASGALSVTQWLEEVPRSNRMCLPRELASPVEDVLEAEYRLAIAALLPPSWPRVFSTSILDALRAGRQALANPSRYTVIVPPSSCDAVREKVRYLHTTPDVVPGPEDLAYALMVDTSRPPLTRYITEPLRLDHSVGDKSVRFVVHQRVGFHRDPRAAIVQLVGLNADQRSESPWPAPAI